MWKIELYYASWWLNEPYANEMMRKSRTHVKETNALFEISRKYAEFSIDRQNNFVAASATQPYFPYFFFNRSNTTGGTSVEISPP